MCVWCYTPLTHFSKSQNSLCSDNAWIAFWIDFKIIMEKNLIKNPLKMNWMRNINSYINSILIKMLIDINRRSGRNIIKAINTTSILNCLFILVQSVYFFICRIWAILTNSRLTRGHDLTHIFDRKLNAIIPTR